MNEQVSAVAEDTALTNFNPFSPDFVRNPYPYYHRLRSAEPLHKSPMGFWVATRNQDVALILKDRRFGKGFEQRTIKRVGEQAFKHPAYASMRHWMLVQDPPDHTRLRGLVTKAFTARRIEEWRPRIERAVSELLDTVEGRSSMDFIKEFAYPLPVNVICDILGIPASDRARFAIGSRASGRLIDPTPMSPQELEEADNGFLEQEAYFKDLFARRRKEPQDDLTTHLVQAEEAGDRLTTDELVANVILLFGAGHETTVNLLGNGLFALLQCPEELAKLKADPSLIPNAVEEMLRFDSSVQLTGRMALEDVEIGGVTIAKEEYILCLLGAANRDPETFAEPDEFKVDRPDVKPQSFGGGIHFCLGAQLARVEAEIAFRALLERLPGLRLSDPDNPDWRPTFTLRGLMSLPVAW